MKTVCITCPESTARGADAVKHFADMGVVVQWFWGIHAAHFGLFTTHPYLVDNPERGGMIIPQNQVGCFLSHYMLWSALDLAAQCECGLGDRVLVIEDDCEFPSDWQARFSRAMNDVPKDFDLLYIGNSNCEGREQKQISGEVWEVKWPLATHAYVVSRKALPVLLSTQRKVYAPVDISLYFHSLPLLRVYTVLPRICHQRGTQLFP